MNLDRITLLKNAGLTIEEGESYTYAHSDPTETKDLRITVCPFNKNQVEDSITVRFPVLNKGEVIGDAMAIFNFPADFYHSEKFNQTLSLFENFDLSQANPNDEIKNLIGNIEEEECDTDHFYLNFYQFDEENRDPKLFELCIKLTQKKVLSFI